MLPSRAYAEAHGGTARGHARNHIQTLRSRVAVPPGIHQQGHHPRRPLRPPLRRLHRVSRAARGPHRERVDPDCGARDLGVQTARDRKSTRLNSSHSQISYAVFCLKKKKKKKKKKTLYIEEK